MKKILCFSLAILILTISILVYCPLGVFASYPDDYFSLSKPYTDSMGLSSSDAQAAVNAHKDIADSNGILCFQYTPTNTYNWTMNTKKQKIHLSDNQLKNLLMSKHSLSHGFLEFIYGASNSNAYRGFISSVGVATKTDSDTLLGISDKITGNYNYLNAIDYNEDTQTISMSNDNGSVDKLREEIKKYYYESIGLKFIKPVGTVKKYVDSSDFRKLFEYEDDYTSAYSVCNSDYAFVSGVNFAYFSKGNKSNLTGYYYMGNSDDDKRNSFTDWTTSVYTYRLYSYDSSGHSQAWEINNESYSVFYNYEWDNSTDFKPNPAFLVPMWVCPYYGQLIFNKDMRYESATDNNKWRYTDFKMNYYSNDNSSFKYFASYSAMYNFINGDQNAYLSSTIEKTGQDITFSIKDMNANLGNKMDTLIDSINSNKSNMSADELQNAIDKGLEDLNKNTEDIKDNTEEMNNKLDSILEALNTQNETLLEILGVTKKISDTVDDIDDTANFNTVISLCGTVFLAIQSAILYGQNTLKNDNNEATTQSLAYDSTDIAVCASGGGTSLDYRGGIFGHFPFSVIYHLYDWLKVLQTQPKCPEFSYNYGYLIGKKDDEKCVITFDLSQYEDWRKTISSFMKLSFTLAVAVGTYKKFKGGDVT